MHWENHNSLDMRRAHGLDLAIPKFLRPFLEVSTILFFSSSRETSHTGVRGWNLTLVVKTERERVFSALVSDQNYRRKISQDAKYPPPGFFP